MELIEIPTAEYTQLIMQKDRLLERLATERAKNHELRRELANLTDVLADLAGRLGQVTL